MNFPFQNPAVSTNQPTPHPGPTRDGTWEEIRGHEVTWKPLGEAILEAGMVYFPNLNEESPFRTLESSKSQGIFV